MSKSDPYAPKARPNIYDSAPVSSEAAHTPAPAQEESKDVTAPTGTVNEILAWVDGDNERAQVALDAERDGAGRKTLISTLEEQLSE